MTTHLLFGCYCYDTNEKIGIKKRMARHLFCLGEGGLLEGS